MLNTKRIFLSAVTGALLGVSAGAAWAQTDYPSQAITFVVPRAPGGGSDTITRIVAPGLEKEMGVPIQIENRPDTTAVLGAELVAKSKPDGYTLYVSDNSFYQNPAVLPSLPYDTIKDFSAVTMYAQGPVILIAHPSVGVNNLQELIAKAKQEKITYASGGIGSSTHLVGVLLNLKADIDMVHVPYKSSGEALNALVGGHINTQFGGISSARTMIESGKVIPLAVTGDERDPAMPDVPTLQEQGVEGADLMSVWGVHAPAGTPIEVRRKLRDGIVKVMNQPDIKKRLNELGYAILGNTPEEHQKQTEDTVNQWLEVAKKVDLSD